MTNTERIQANNAELREAIEMAESLPEAGGNVTEPVIEPLEITENGTYIAPDGVDGYSPVTVEVLPHTAILTVIPTKNNQIYFAAFAGLDGYDHVAVEPIPDEYIIPSGVLEIAENGTHDVTQYASVNVNVPTGGGTPSIDGIPAGWARTYYIQFNGTQTVDTGIIGNQNTKIQLAFTRERSSQHYMYGVASSDNTASITAYVGGSWRFGNKYVTKSPATSANMIYSGLVDKSNVIITGNSSAISGVTEFETVGSLLLGACRNSDGTLGASQFVGKIFFFSMWDGDEPVLKLVPVTDGSTYRFFDMVSKTFFDSITETPLDGGVL